MSMRTTPFWGWMVLTGMIAGCSSQPAPNREEAPSSSAPVAANKAVQEPVTVPTADASGQVVDFSRFEGTVDGARQLVETFLAPGADSVALTSGLKPRDADYGVVFGEEHADRIREMYAGPWANGEIAIAPKQSQTEVKLWRATAKQLADGTGDAQQFPGGWKTLAPTMAEETVWFRFKFVEPGQELGMAYDGLVYLGDHWALFPKAYRAIR